MSSQSRFLCLSPDLLEDFKKSLAQYSLSLEDLEKQSQLRVSQPDSLSYLLLKDEDGTWKISDPQEKTWHGLKVDFLNESFQYRVERSPHSKEILRDALKIRGKSHKLKILDATAGLGEDAFMMSVWGNQVHSCEKNPLIYFLLAQGGDCFSKLNTKSLNLEWTLSWEDSLSRSQKNEIFDVVYLDPMFPQNPKKALNKKDLRVLSDILSQEAPSDEELKSMLLSFKKIAKQKIIIKRPPRALALPPVPGLAYYSLEGPSVRLDVYNIV